MSDPYFANVVYLAQFSGADGSTSFIDQSSYGHVITAVGNAQILNNKLELDGSGDWVSSPDADELSPGSGDFTFEIFGIEFDNAAADGQILSKRDDQIGNEREFDLIFKGTLSPQKLRAHFSVDGFGASSEKLIDVNWSPASAPNGYDIAFVRSGTDIYLYVDGARIGADTLSIDIFNSTSPLSIGATNTVVGPAFAPMNGRLSAVRLSIGIARYTGASYTVPTLPLPTAAAGIVMRRTLSPLGTRTGSRQVTN